MLSLVKNTEKKFKLFFEKGLTRGIFGAILHIHSTDNTVNTVKTEEVVQ